MAAKNPLITGAAQSVTSAHLREMSKGRPEAAAPPPKARKKFQTVKPKAEEPEPQTDGTEAEDEG